MPRAVVSDNGVCFADFFKHRIPKRHIGTQAIFQYNDRFPIFYQRNFYAS